MTNETIAIDTVALLAYLVNKHSEKAEKIFEEVENAKITLLIPSIVIGEMIYTILKGREIFGNQIEKNKIEFILETLYQNPSFKITGLTYEGWTKFMGLTIPELHDRMIVATCLQEEVRKIITKDEEIIKSGLLDTIW